VMVDRKTQGRSGSLPLLFLCGSDMWGRGWLGLLGQQIEEGMGNFPWCFWN
jgi:hypothetical protein